MWMYFSLWDIYMGVELLGHVVNSVVNHLRVCQTFPKWLPYFTSQLAYEGYQLFHMVTGPSCYL